MQPKITKLTIFVVLAIAVLGFTIFALTPKDSTLDETRLRQNRNTINIIVAPINDSIVTLNGKGVRAGTIEVEPGSYTVNVSHAGFATETRQLTIKQGDRATVAVALNSNSPATANWYRDHPEDAEKGEEVGGANSDITAQAQSQKLPFLKRLPVIMKDRYRIDFGSSEKYPNDPSATTIYIAHADEASKKAAENWIRYQGYAPASLEIVYSQASGPALR